jgi:hypothetical protein
MKKLATALGNSRYGSPSLEGSAARAGARVALICALLAPGAAASAEDGQQAFDLHSGQELTFAVTIDGAKAALGKPRVSRFGTAQPKDGEMTVGLGPRDAKTLREDVIVTEKTPVPIDFLATGLIGGTKIDEAVLCGRLDAPASAHIGAVSWRVRLHAFEVRRDGATCE